MKNSEKPAYAFSYNPNEDHGEPGLTKREHFAAMMLQGSIERWNDEHIKEGVKRAIQAADELLKQLEA